MSILGETGALLGLLGKVGSWIGKGWEALRNRLDPAGVQAKRLIETFEAYGIARQQIPRLLPPELKLPNAAFSTPDKLKDKLTSDLLDWAASHLGIRRSWLDGVSDMPHLMEDHYKSPAGYRAWLANRLELAPNVHRYLRVWKPQDQALPGGYGPLCLIYEESVDGLDASEGTDFTRFWLLSDRWRLDHAPCLENLLAVIAVTRSLGIWVLGSEVPMGLLKQLESGKKLIPDVVKRQRKKWHPEDLIEPLPGEDTEWRRALWQGAQEYLANDGLPAELPGVQPSKV